MTHHPSFNKFMVTILKCRMGGDAGWSPLSRETKMQTERFPKVLTLVLITDYTLRKGI